jgi:plasmid stability protein
MISDQSEPGTEPQTTSLLIRGLDPELKDRLRIQAAQHGHSMQAELRDILRHAVGQSNRNRPRSLAEAIHRRFAALGGVELEPYPDTPVGEPRVRFDP